MQIVRSASTYGLNPFDILTIVSVKCYSENADWELQVWETARGERVRLLAVYPAGSNAEACAMELSVWDQILLCPFYGPRHTADGYPLQPALMDSVCSAERECIYQIKGEGRTLCGWRGRPGRFDADPGLCFVDDIKELHRERDFLDVIEYVSGRRRGL
jgi:hypothetical protein